MFDVSRLQQRTPGHCGPARLLASAGSRCSVPCGWHMPPANRRQPVIFRLRPHPAAPLPRPPLSSCVLSPSLLLGKQRKFFFPGKCTLSAGIGASRPSKRRPPTSSPTALVALANTNSWTVTSGNQHDLHKRGGRVAGRAGGRCQWLKGTQNNVSSRQIEEEDFAQIVI